MCSRMMPIRPFGRLSASEHRNGRSPSGICSRCSSSCALTVASCSESERVPRSASSRTAELRSSSPRQRCSVKRQRASVPSPPSRTHAWMAGPMNSPLQMTVSKASPIVEERKAPPTATAVLAVTCGAPIGGAPGGAAGGSGGVPSARTIRARDSSSRWIPSWIPSLERSSVSRCGMRARWGRTKPERAEAKGRSSSLDESPMTKAGRERQAWWRAARAIAVGPAGGDNRSMEWRSSKKEEASDQLVDA
mmetsp:Transcript_47310/g.106687  ORF Transcript_47310/g.106687 Transcript_47310/m.106687 type:complete len:249 (+) Transcript_47310:826-1572(+)